MSCPRRHIHFEFSAGTNLPRSDFQPIIVYVTNPV